MAKTLAEALGEVVEGVGHSNFPIFFLIILLLLLFPGIGSRN